MPNTADIVRSLEVRGSLAAMGDLGLIKCASSEEEINDLTEKVASVIPEYGYTTEDILDAATYFTSGGYEKTASEQYESDIKEALGELLLMKVAGDIDTETFQQEADPLVKEAISLKGIVGKARTFGKNLYNMDHKAMGAYLKAKGTAAKDYLKDGFKAQTLRDAMSKRKAFKEYGGEAKKIFQDPKKNGDAMPDFLRGLKMQFKGRTGTKEDRARMRGLGQVATAYGLAGAGLAGAGYGGKKLYDKYAR